MNKYEELLNSLKDQLKNMVTADNTETITKAVGIIDELGKVHKEALDENSKLKDKIVDIVKGTTFKDSLEGKAQGEDTPLTFEEACKQAEKEILEKRKGEK